jgi:hypothetical protein
LAAVSAFTFDSLGPVSRNLLDACDDGALNLYDANGSPLLGNPWHHAVGRAGGLATLNLLQGHSSSRRPPVFWPKDFSGCTIPADYQVSNAITFLRSSMISTSNLQDNHGHSVSRVP